MIILSLQWAGTISFQFIRLYWSTSSNDLNSVTQNRCNKSFKLIQVSKKESRIYEAPLFDIYE